MAASGEGAGLTVGAVALDLGVDARALATGRLDATGRAVIRAQPEFPEGAGRLHLQAVTAPSGDFAALAVTPPKVVRNALGLTALGPVLSTGSPPAPAGPAEASGVAGGDPRKRRSVSVMILGVAPFAHSISRLLKAAAPTWRPTSSVTTVC